MIEGKIFKHGTAEELAEDEQVRRLYLGRNFELKRKDYLHEEAMLGAGKEVKLNNLIRVIQNCITETDKVINDYIDWEPSLTGTDTLSLGMSSDSSYRIVETTKVEDYCRYLEEIKRSLCDYAITTNDEYLKQKAIKISSISCSTPPVPVKTPTTLLSSKAPVNSLSVPIRPQMTITASEDLVISMFRPE